MSCIDKRMEASRDQFIYDPESNSRDVDFVLTSKDLLKLILVKSSAEEFLNEEISLIDPNYNNIDHNGMFYSVGGGPSDGYLEYIFKRAALELFGVKINSINYTYNTKTKDFKETSLEVNSKTVLRFAAVYGFRNIQTVIRQIKKGECPYHYIEVMACPSGCTNGGGQIESTDEASISPTEILNKVNELYNSQPVMEPGLRKEVIDVYEEWINPNNAQELLFTNYKRAEMVKTKPKTGCKCAAAVDPSRIW